MPKRLQTKGEKKKKPARRPTPVRSSHKEGASPKIGNEERLLEKKIRAFELRRDGHNLIQISQVIQKEMGLKDAPSYATVSSWIKDAHEMCRGKLEEMVEQETGRAVENMSRIISRFMPLAMGQLHVERDVQTPDGKVAIVDEKAFTEQTKAAEQVRKTTETLMKMLGVLSDSKKEDEKGNADVPGGLRSMQFTIIQQNAQVIVSGPAAIHEQQKRETPIITIDSGNPAIAALEDFPDGDAGANA